VAWRRLVFAMVLFHAVVQERRRFGPLGWNIPYGFSDADLSSCLLQVHDMLEDTGADKLPFEVLRLLCGDVNYGGRVTDDQDRRLLTTLLHPFLQRDLLEETGFSFSASGLSPFALVLIRACPRGQTAARPPPARKEPRDKNVLLATRRHQRLAVLPATLHPV
jgi:hypothetical protein